MSNEPFEISASRQFTSWMAELNISLAITTYQYGRLLLIGRKEDGRLTVNERNFRRCMGLAVDPTSDCIWMSSLIQVWRLQNILGHGELYKGFDRVYVPQVGYTTGDIDIHDIGAGLSGEPVFANTLFSCLATVSSTHSFKPIWTPPFISRLAAEERCHLNGLAMADGRPAYVTALSESDRAYGWRDGGRESGCLISVEGNQVLLRGLSMPHSPRIHEGRVWLLNAGTNEFGWVDLERESFVPVARCPGFARGLALHGHFAVIGLSKTRADDSGFGTSVSDPPLTNQEAEARCGVIVVDLRTGDTVHALNITGAIEELYDVAVVPNTRRPMAIGFLTDEIRRAFSIETGNS